MSSGVAPEALARAEKIQQKINNGTAGKLAGMIIGLKDNISYKGHQMTASSKILDGYQVDAMTIVGGIMLICISFRLLNIKNVAVGNLLPALAIAPVFALLVHSL